MLAGPARCFFFHIAGILRAYHASSFGWCVYFGSRFHDLASWISVLFDNFMKECCISLIGSAGGSLDVVQIIFEDYDQSHVVRYRVVHCYSRPPLSIRFLVSSQNCITLWMTSAEDPYIRCFSIQPLSAGYTRVAVVGLGIFILRVKSRYLFDVFV